jgi:N-methylhydantoinase A
MVTLGRLPAVALGGGSIPIDPEAAAGALVRLAPRIGVRSAVEVAVAVVTVANARMEAALRRVSVERGHDPRDAALVAFGGAGGLHACELADALGIPAVVFPAHAGVLSALGAARAPERYEASRTVMRPARDAAMLRREAERLARTIRRRFRRSGASVISRTVLARYGGQSHELEIALAGQDLERRFHEAHRRAYGFAREREAVEVVTVDVVGSIATADARPPRAPARGGRPGATARAWVGHAMRRVPLRDWGGLRAHDVLRGPAIVLQSGATLWVAPGWRGRLHASGALVLERSGR